MRTARTAGQKLINLWMDQKALIELDRFVVESGYADRSQFVRDAICEKLERSGFPVPKQLFYAPSRIGKGGRPTHRAGKETAKPTGAQISSYVRAVERAGTEADIRAIKRRRVKS